MFTFKLTNISTFKFKLTLGECKTISDWWTSSNSSMQFFLSNNACTSLTFHKVYHNIIFHAVYIEFELSNSHILLHCFRHVPGNSSQLNCYHHSCPTNERRNDALTVIVFNNFETFHFPFSSINRKTCGNHLTNMNAALNAHDFMSIIITLLNKIWFTLTTKCIDVCIFIQWYGSACHFNFIAISMTVLFSSI